MYVLSPLRCALSSSRASLTIVPPMLDKSAIIENIKCPKRLKCRSS